MPTQPINSIPKLTYSDYTQYSSHIDSNGRTVHTNTVYHIALYDYSGQLREYHSNHSTVDFTV